MTNAIIEAARTQLQEDYRRAGKELKGVPGVGSLPDGRTPDSVVVDPYYRAAKLKFDRAFEALRTFNAKFKPQRRAR
jgi:hypothetical protein